jgi:ankyrin repeat protein
MPEINLDTFKESFKDQNADINLADVQEYVRKEIYGDDEPVYGNGAKTQMDALIQKAKNIRLTNFKDLEQHGENEDIKSSAEAVLYLLKDKDVSLYKDRTFACGAGTLTNLQNILLDINGLNSLEFLVSRYKKEMLEAIAKEMLEGKKEWLGVRLRLSQAMEVHNVTSLLNVIAEDYGIIKNTKDVYCHEFTGEYPAEIKKYFDDKIKVILSKYEDVVDGIVGKLEISLPEFDKTKINDDKYNTEYYDQFAENVDQYGKDITESYKEIFGEDAKLFIGILLIDVESNIIGFKDNHREILKDFIALYLKSNETIELTDDEKSKIITRIKIESGSQLTKEELTDEMLKHALDHDLIVTVGHQVIDPIKTYLDSADEAKIQYAKDHVKSNRQKYGGTAEEVILSLNEGNLYGDLINQRKFAKESAKATFHNHCKDNDFTNLEADLKNLREYNALDALYTTKDKDGRTAFRYAVEKGNAEVFKEILGAAKDHSDILKELLNAKDKDGSTAFHYAVSKGKTEVVKEILAAAKDHSDILKEVLTSKSRNGQTVLHRAAEKGNADVVKEILAAVKDNAVLLQEVLSTPKNSLEETALHYAAEKGNADVVKEILSAAEGAGILKEVLNTQDKYGKTALHYAVSEEKADVVEKILGVTKDHPDTLKELLTAKNKYGETALDVQMRIGNADMVKKMLAAAQEAGILKELLSDKDLLKKILVIKHPDGKSVLHSADDLVAQLQDLVPQGRADVVEKILAAAKYNPEWLKELIAEDKNVSTVLHDAFSWGKADVVEKILAAMKNHPQLLKEMLNAKGIYTRTPLCYAVYQGNAEMVEKILDAVKDNPELLQELLTARDKDEKTALGEAVFWGKAEMVEKILAAVKDNPELLQEVLTARDKDEKTALGEAVFWQKDEVIEKILDAVKGNPKLLQEVLTAKSRDGQTVLQYPAYWAKTGVIENILATAKDDLKLLKEILVPNHQNGMTALYYAVKNLQTEVVKEILAAAKDNPELLKEVLNAENKYGETALHRAVNHLQIDVVEKILDAAKDSGILKKINLKPLIDWKVVGNEGFAVCDVNDLVTQFKGLIPPAKWSHVIPDTWVSKISERGTYWKERDALIEVVVNKYLEDMGCEIRDHRFYLVTKSMESIEEEIKKIITSHEEEIKKFLSETGHYNVEPKQIKEAMEECGKDSKDSFVNRILNKEPNTNTNPFNAF